MTSTICRHTTLPLFLSLSFAYYTCTMYYCTYYTHLAGQFQTVFQHSQQLVGTHLKKATWPHHKRTGLLDIKAHFHMQSASHGAQTRLAMPSAQPIQPHTPTDTCQVVPVTDHTHTLHGILVLSISIMYFCRG